MFHSGTLVTNVIFVAVTLITIFKAVTTSSISQPKSGKNTLERNGFRLLGTVSKPKTVIDAFGTTAVIKEEWVYWESVNSLGWDRAKMDCQANGDTLLYMETRDEVANVTRWLQDSEISGELYWVGGKYDVVWEEFVWDNGIKISADAPWGDGQPKDKHPNTRVAAATIGREIELKTLSGEMPHRYICEGQREDD